VEPSNILRHELIGLRLRVLKSSSRGNAGLHGRVLDESRNMIILDTVKGRKMVPKKDAVFEFTLQNGASTRVDGRLLVGRPEDRLVDG